MGQSSRRPPFGQARTCASVALPASPGPAVERRAVLAGLCAIADLVAFDPAQAKPPAPAIEKAGSPVQVPATAPATHPAAIPYLVLDDMEAHFVTLAVDLFIPADALSPAGSELGVVTYIDRQLASGWGMGGGSFRIGPFLPGTPQQGEQLPLPPRAFIRAGIAATGKWILQSTGRSFADLPPAQQIAALRSLEKGEATLEGIDGAAFFNALLQLAMEGLFSDPLYGGNAGMAGWKMLGFPGLPAFYAAEIEPNRGKRYTAEPQSIVDFL